MRGISWLAEDLLFSQERLCRMESVSQLCLVRALHEFASRFLPTEHLTNGQQWKVTGRQICCRQNLHTSSASFARRLGTSAQTVKAKALPLSNDKRKLQLLLTANTKCALKGKVGPVPLYYTQNTYVQS
jgi:DNA-binding transcriptional regulator YiaG